MKISEFYSLLNRENQLSNLCNIKVALREIAKSVFMTCLNLDNMPNVVSKDDEAEIKKLLVNCRKDSVDVFSQIWVDFAPERFENAANSVGIMADKMCEIEDLLLEREALPWWRFGRRRKLNREIAEQDVMFSVWQEVLYVWACYEVVCSNDPKAFVLLLKEEVAKTIGELHQKALDMYDF